jgi:hypothetical protein
VQAFQPFGGAAIMARVKTILLLALSMLWAGLSSAPALAQYSAAGACVNRCGNACYNKPAGCETSCQQQCMAAQQNAGPPDTHGSIYIGKPPSSAIGWSYGALDSRQAEGLAANACAQRNNGQPCYPLITYTNRCAVAVKGVAKGEIQGVFGKARPQLADAQQEAMQACKERLPNARCEVEASSCSNQH